MSKEFTGVLTRDGKPICVGDKVDSVQGTVFDVIKLEDATGVKYALHDGKRPYDLKEWMSPNLWLVEVPDHGKCKEALKQDRLLLASISALISAYKIRFAKIEKAANSISEWNQEKAYKVSAAKQTKLFISDLRKLQRGCR